jgi:UDP-sulfoquinovose synthase
VQLAVENPAEVGFMRVFNQFTESFTLTELAQTIKDEAEKMGYEPTIAYVDNPRTEDEDHYYNPVSTGLPELGLKPTLLAGDVLSNMLRKIDEHKDRVDTSVIRMNVKWKND